MGTTVINKAVQDASGDFTLYRNNKIAFCPKTALAMPVQSNMGGGITMQHSRFPCSTNCPFANIIKGKPSVPAAPTETDTDNIDVYYISCEGGYLTLKLDEIQLHEPQKKQPGTIISINDKQ